MHNIYFSTSEDMSMIKSGSVKLMITSPPYWDLKDYEMEDQIGYKEDYSTYLRRLKKVWNETYRVLGPEGIAIININTKSNNNRLVLIPYDFIRQMKQIGFHFRDIHYWHKSSGIPRPNNFGDHFEYFLIFSKGKEPLVNPGSFFDYKIKSEGVSKNPNIWNINKKFGSIGKKFMVHPAIFPVEYIKRMIQIFTKEGDFILDPFLGSGTTLISSEVTNRVCFGFELNKEGYLPLIHSRLEEEKIPPSKIKFS
jgi:DNA modification methylase